MTTVEYIVLTFYGISLATAAALLWPLARADMKARRRARRIRAAAAIRADIKARARRPAES